MWSINAIVKAIRFGNRTHVKYARPDAYSIENIRSPLEDWNNDIVDEKLLSDKSSTKTRVKKQNINSHDIEFS